MAECAAAPLKLAVFTGTGNSLMLAKWFAQSYPGAADIVPIRRAASFPLNPAETLGVFFPVYMGGLPRIVADFLAAVPLEARSRVFAVANYGGMLLGAMLQTRRILAARGIPLAASWGVKMPGNYTPLGGALPDDKQQKLFSRAQKSMALAAGRIARTDAPAQQTIGLPVWRNIALGIYRLMAPQIPVMDRHFHVTDACNGCGLCAAVCPVGDIELRDGKPAWLGHCEQCYACEDWCPQAAIETGKMTCGKKRYHHPDVSAEEIAALRKSR